MAARIAAAVCPVGPVRTDVTVRLITALPGIALPGGVDATEGRLGTGASTSRPGRDCGAAALVTGTLLPDRCDVPRASTAIHPMTPRVGVPSASAIAATRVNGGLTLPTLEAPVHPDVAILRLVSVRGLRPRPYLQGILSS